MGGKGDCCGLLPLECIDDNFGPSRQAFELQSRSDRIVRVPDSNRLMMSDLWGEDDTRHVDGCLAGTVPQRRAVEEQ